MDDSSCCSFAPLCSCSSDEPQEESHPAGAGDATRPGLEGREEVQAATLQVEGAGPPKEPAASAAPPPAEPQGPQAGVKSVGSRVQGSPAQPVPAKSQERELSFEEMRYNFYMERAAAQGQDLFWKEGAPGSAQRDAGSQGLQELYKETLAGRGRGVSVLRGRAQGAGGGRSY